MAFSYTVGRQKDLGTMKRLYGTWNAASVTTGTVTWKGTVLVNEVLGAGVTNLTASAAATAWHVSTSAGTLVIGVCASSDVGTWWVDFA